MTPPKLPENEPSTPIQIDDSVRRRRAAVAHHRDCLLALTGEASTWRAPLQSVDASISAAI